MKLTTLLEAHKANLNAPGALKESFGDGYLVAKNRVYAAIRKRTLEAGFRFTHKINDSYIALSLSQLDKIMADKEIPFLNNVTVLEPLPATTVWDDISDNLKGNHVFHESCHAVAKTFSAKPETNEEKILTLLLEESFANTCELLSIVDAGDQIHRIFIELNSYVYMLDDRTNLANAIRDMSSTTVLHFMVLAYLHANFLREMKDADFDRAFALASEKSLDPKNKKTLRALSKIAFKLNPRFREVTTRFYLKLNNIPTTVESLKSYDFLRVIEQNPKFLKLAGTLL